MNKEQYERWKDFARRMVKVAVGARNKAPSRALTLEIIDFFFECRMDAGEEWKQVKNWDYTKSIDEDFKRNPMCVSSHLDDIADNFVPDYWKDTRRDDDGEAFFKRKDRWMGPACCCLRAGLDIAVSPSAGVAGFKAGQIRKMYPEGVPDWVKKFFKPEREVFDMVPTNVDGVYGLENRTIDKRTFDEIPDAEEVWL